MDEKKAEKLAKRLNIELDDENRAILKMKVADDSSFLSPFYFDKPILSNEAADYLLSHKMILLWRSGVHIKLISDVISKEEEPIYSSAIKGYFEESALRGKRTMKRNYVLSALLFLIGLMVFALMFILDHFLGDGLGMWSEVIDVIAWVFIWEAVDIAFIEKLENSYNVKMAHNLIDSRVSFEPLEGKKEGER